MVSTRDRHYGINNRTSTLRAAIVAACTKASRQVSVGTARAISPAAGRELATHVGVQGVS